MRTGTIRRARGQAVWPRRTWITEAEFLRRIASGDQRGRRALRGNRECSLLMPASCACSCGNRATVAAVAWSRGGNPQPVWGRLRHRASQGGSAKIPSLEHGRESAQAAPSRPATIRALHAQRRRPCTRIQASSAMSSVATAARSVRAEVSEIAREPGQRRDSQATKASSGTAIRIWAAALADVGQVDHDRARRDSGRRAPSLGRHSRPPAADVVVELDERAAAEVGRGLVE